MGDSPGHHGQGGATHRYLLSHSVPRLYALAGGRSSAQPTLPPLAAIQEKLSQTVQAALPPCHTAPHEPTCLPLPADSGGVQASKYKFAKGAIFPKASSVLVLVHSNVGI